MNRLVIVLCALVAALGIVALALFERAGDLERRLEALESAPRALPDQGAGPGGPTLAPGQASELARRIEEGLGAMGRRVVALEERGTRGEDPLAGTLDSPAFSEAVRRVAIELARDDVAFRSAIQTSDRTKLGKDPPFARVAEALELDAAQESEFAKEIQAAQGELFQLLSEPRDDGVVPLERIAEAEALPASDPRKAQVFIDLFTLRIPGSEETYMQRAVAMALEFRKKMRPMLRPPQQDLFDAVEFNLFEVKFN